MLKSHYRDISENQDKLWWYLGMKDILKSLGRLYAMGKTQNNCFHQTMRI